MNNELAIAALVLLGVFAVAAVIVGIVYGIWKLAECLTRRDDQ